MNVRFGPAFDKNAYVKRKKTDDENRCKSKKFDNAKNEGPRTEISSPKLTSSIFTGFITDDEFPTVEKVLQGGVELHDLTGEKSQSSDKQRPLLPYSPPIENTTMAQG